MKDRRVRLRLSALLAVFSLTVVVLATFSCQAQTPSTPTGILNRDQAGPLLPPSVFYRGQVAPVQARNSAGYRFGDGKLFLAALVDTSGYSSAVQQTYQGYLILEVPMKIGDKVLAPGAYGFGFVAPNRMVAMDLGSNQVLSTSTTLDASLARPNPLQILPAPTSPNSFRLYLGRSYATVEAAMK
jgi:hypothetical protein